MEQGKKNVARVLLSIICISVILCVSCNPTEKELSDSYEWELQLAMLKDKAVSELPEKLEVKVTDDLEINASILVSGERKSNEAPELTLTRHIYSDDEMRENTVTLMKAGSFPYEEDKIECNVDNGSGFEDKVERMTYDLWIDTYSGVGSAANCLMIATDDGARLLDVLMFPFEKGAVQFCYKEKQELEFGKWEEAWKSVQNVLKKCGVESIADMHCYSLDLKSLQHYLDKYHEAEADFYFQSTGEAPEYTKEDEAYFFQFQQGYDEIPICKYQLEQTLEKQDFGYGTYSDGYAVYSSKGLIYFYANNLFDIEKTGNTHAIVPLSDVLEKSVSNLKTLASGRTSVEVKEISLCYLPTVKDAEKMEFQAVPVWVVAYIQTGTSVGDTEVTIDESKYDVYNAFTGEKMY
ncbi:MAG: hypothetical protein PUC12_11810 [Clostridiales bacterium]|nr:hypothetical protein [Clostridiales bacterium]